MHWFVTAIAVGAALFSAVTSIASIAIYVDKIVPFITGIPEYVGNFITSIQYFIPPYVVAPFIAMLSILVCYLIIHLLKSA